MPSKKSKAVRGKKSTGWNWSKWRTITQSKSYRRIAASPGARATIIAIICVLGVGVLFAARRPADTSNPTAGGADKALAANAVGTVGAIPLPEPSNFPPMAPVTITGCLEQRNEGFRLKDASGTDVPKSRSWKSGFMKKSSPPIDVIDANRKLKFPNHLGERVSVTGVLMNREMQVRSMQTVGATCS